MDAQAGIRRWSTDAVAPQRRLACWVGVLCEAFVELEAGSREGEAFGGAVCSRPLGPLVASQVTAAPHDVYRTAAAIARSRHQPFLLLSQRHAAWSLRQGGHLLHLRPGDVVLLDTSMPAELHFPQGCGGLWLTLPRAWVGACLSRVDTATPRIAWREQDWGRTLSALCLQLADELPDPRRFPPALLAEHLGALLAACLEPPAPAAAGDAAPLAQRACTLLEQRLDQPGLLAPEVARELRVSVRTLHRALAAAGLSFTGVLREARMALARRLLASGRSPPLPIAEIARRCGYTDASHFSRDFRRCLGVSPAAWRERKQD